MARKVCEILLIIALLAIASLCLAGGDKWIKKADMPFSRFGMSANAVDGKIYLVGGLIDSQGNIIYTGVDEYDPKTETWTKKSDMPTPRVYVCASVVNDKIYAIGGVGANGLGVPTNEEYDPKTDKWSKKADMPTGRWLFSTSAVNGKIYAFGGASNERLSNIEEYDPVADKWTIKKDMPAKRTSFSSVAMNGKIYIIGGSINAGVNAPDVDEYDPKTSKWKKVAKMPTVRFDLCTSVVNGKIYAIGGGITEIVGNVFGGEGINAVEEYDQVEDEWFTRADMPTARYYFAQEVVDGKIYAFGGIKTSFGWVCLPTVEEYTPMGWPFSVYSQDKLIKTWGEIKQNP